MVVGNNFNRKWDRPPGLSKTGQEACPWSFYICSGGGTADELFFREFDLEFFQEFGVFVHFLA
jgi:hypothetical protein